jgi:two-component system nitrogen regulation response regulator GlnG
MLSNAAELASFPAKEPATMGNIPQSAKNPPPSVLIVDDEALIRWTLTEMLGERGYQVTEAADGRSALAEIASAEDPFDVVLLDFRLPDSADLRLLERIRTEAPASRVIMMSAHSSPELIQGAEALGVYSVVGKPFEVANIAALVEQARNASTNFKPGRS